MNEKKKVKSKTTVQDVCAWWKGAYNNTGLWLVWVEKGRAHPRFAQKPKGREWEREGSMKKEGRERQERLPSSIRSFQLFCPIKISIFFPGAYSLSQPPTLSLILFHLILWPIFFHPRLFSLFILSIHASPGRYSITGWDAWKRLRYRLPRGKSGNECTYSHFTRLPHNKQESRNKRAYSFIIFTLLSWTFVIHPRSVTNMNSITFFLIFCPYS